MALDTPLLTIETEFDGQSTIVELTWTRVPYAEEYLVFGRDLFEEQDSLLFTTVDTLYSAALNTNWDWVESSNIGAQFYVVATGLELPMNGLRVHYPFNGNTDDVSGNDNHSLLLGGASVSTFLSIPDDATSRLSIPMEVFQGLSDFTISATLRTSIGHSSCPSGNTPGNTFLNISSPASAGVYWFLYESQQNRWRVNLVSSYDLGNSEMEAGNDYAVCFVREGMQLKLYYNGILRSQVALSDGLPLDVSPASDVAIIGLDQDEIGGDFERCQSWNGSVDNFRVYD
ncbi:MAG: LamG domain-containing protein, partial [Taibaiella sp.]|nr:LamG domain-containing protein [Taibaiella sp.]